MEGCINDEQAWLKLVLGHIKDTFDTQEYFNTWEEPRFQINELQTLCTTYLVIQGALSNSNMAAYYKQR